MLLGAHRSTAGGAWKAAESGREIGCEAIQVFTRAPMRWEAKAIGAEEAHRFRETCAALGLRTLAHDIYLTNLASPKDGIRVRSIASFKDEIARCEMLGIPFLITHCGSHDGSGEEQGISRVAQALRECVDASETDSVRVLLEGTAGQGDQLGWRFEQLAAMLDQSERPDRTGVCLDTCHMYAAGYDIKTEEGYQRTFQEFDRIVGLHRLFAFHGNDCKKDLGSRVDRHEHIGEGKLGDETFRRLLRDERFRDLPLLLETPDLQKHGNEIQHLRELAGAPPA